jgi:hypothetical protein
MTARRRGWQVATSLTQRGIIISPRLSSLGLNRGAALEARSAQTVPPLGICGSEGLIHAGVHHIAF